MLEAKVRITPAVAGSVGGRDLNAFLSVGPPLPSKDMYTRSTGIQETFSYLKEIGISFV